MVFNSFTFLIYFLVVFFAYWFLFQKNLRLQNLFIFAVSYLFYGWWDYRFLGLLFLSSIIDFFIGVFLERTEGAGKRKALLAVSLIFNLGLLGFFKYYNFFVDSFITAFESLGISLQARTLSIILPVGISFYTFQSLSYTIDVYKKDLKATTDFILFGAFVSFFPQLVAGPIERAVHLIPQFQKKRFFDYAIAKDGVKQILWGMFKKVVVADTCGAYTNYIFDHHEYMSSISLLTGAVFFAFQIYCDFSGYSDMALGLSKLFGFRLMTNFRYPYFSRDVAEFWRRWHISLTTWFRDYVYIPLGGSRVSVAKQVRNTFIIFILSGFWHGANWTFIVWGALNACYFIPLLLMRRNRKNVADIHSSYLLPSPQEGLAILFTFALTCLAWIFFRAENMSQALSYIGGIFTHYSYSDGLHIGADIFFFIGIMLLLEWMQRNSEYPIQFLELSRPLKAGIYFSIAFIVVAYFNLNNQGFIYFQF